MRLKLHVATLVACAIVSNQGSLSADQPDAPPVTTLEETPAAELPRPPAKPGLTLPRGQLTITFNLEASVSKDRAFEPVSAAPDFSYGVSDDLTLSLVHSGFLATGFRGNAGGGVCLTGADQGCADVYSRTGLEGWYALAKGPRSAAAVLGIYANPIDPLWTQVKLGAKARITRGRLLATWMPSLFVGLNQRDAGNKDALWSPFTLGVKATPKLTLSLGAGFKGPLEDFGDRVTVATGIIGQLAIDKRIGVGASFFMPAVIGGSAVPAAAKGSEPRFVQLWVSYSL